MFQDRLLAGADGIEAHLAKGGPFLKVYDHAYVARLLEVMGEDYPAVHTLLGDDEFGDAARAYVRSRPSSKRSVRWLAATDPWRDLPVLADMARFEWHLGLAFDAPDRPALEFAALAAVPPEAWPSLRFEFHPSLAVFRLGHDVAPFQQAVATERDPDAAPAPLDEQATWAAWRDPESLLARYRALSADEAAGLSRLSDGGDFAALCEVLAEFGDPEQAAMRAAGLLRTWTETGWLADLSAPGMSWS